MKKVSLMESREISGGGYKCKCSGCGKVWLAADKVSVYTLYCLHRFDMFQKCFLMTPKYKIWKT